MKYKKLRGVLLIGREVKVLKDEEIVRLIMPKIEKMYGEMKWLKKECYQKDFYMIRNS